MKPEYRYNWITSRWERIKIHKEENAQEVGIFQTLSHNDDVPFSPIDPDYGDKLREHYMRKTLAGKYGEEKKIGAFSRMLSGLLG